MRKSTKLLKRFAALFLVVLLSYESFAAVVSDNDGAAFITKAEFDSLKNTFQSELNKYNSNIDNRIDGAISGYLTGIKQGKTTKYDLIFAGDTVNFMNGVIDPQFRIPRYMSTISVSGYSTANSTNQKQFGASIDIAYPAAWGSTETHKKPLVKLKEGTEDSITKVYWDGVALRYLEKVVATITKGWKWNDLGWFDYGYEKNIFLSNGFQLLSIGYNNNVENTALTNPSMTARAKDNNGNWSNAGEPQSTPWSYAKSQLAVDLEPYNDVTKDHIHVIQYDGSSQWEVYNELFIHSLRLSLAQTLTDANVWSTVNTDAYRKTNGFYIGGVEGGGFANGGITFTIQTTTNKLASIGLLPSKYRADNIYQVKEDWEKTYKQSWVINDLTLEEGMFAFAAEDEDEIRWDMYFPSIECTNDGSTYVKNQNEVDIYVSSSPFVDKLQVANANDLYKWEDEAHNIKDYVTTVDRKATLRWKMNGRSPIYIKCVPHWTGTSYINNKWDIEMSLKDEYKTVSVTEQQ